MGRVRVARTAAVFLVFIPVILAWAELARAASEYRSEDRTDGFFDEWLAGFGTTPAEGFPAQLVQDPSFLYSCIRIAIAILVVAIVSAMIEFLDAGDRTPDEKLRTPDQHQLERLDFNRFGSALDDLAASLEVIKKELSENRSAVSRVGDGVERTATGVELVGAIAEAEVRDRPIDLRNPNEEVERLLEQVAGHLADVAAFIKHGSPASRFSASDSGYADDIDSDLLR